MSLLDLLFPPRCVGCGSRGRWLCRACLTTIPRLDAHRCSRCGFPNSGVDRCPECWRDPPEFASLNCELRFEGPVRSAIHRLKYRRSRHLVAALIDAFLEYQRSLPPTDVVVPVPLHPSRLAARGYNQSELLARELARRLGRECRVNGLSRVRDTPPQVSLPAAQRWANVRDAFAADETSFAGRSVLLVDDVATTTSTLRAAARALQRAGAAGIDAAVIARATFSSPDRRSGPSS